MWLLDANISHRVKAILTHVGIACATSHERGWAELRNGELVKSAVEGGFTCILTQDILFIEAASKVLKRYPEFAIVLIRLKQQRGRAYVVTFQEFIEKKPIVPKKGQLLEWP